MKARWNFAEASEEKCVQFVRAKTFSPPPRSQSLLLRSPGGLFHWNAQDLQRANKSDRPGRVDRWTEEEGDGGQAQRIACSVHCRWWLREESRKAGEGLLSCPAEWIVLYWGSFRLQLSDGQTLIVISFSLTPHQPFLNSSDARLSTYQLKCHIIKAIIQVHHWKPVFVRPCVRACVYGSCQN